MKGLEIKKGIYWVGAIDWDLREFHGYLTPKGATYNAYLIIDKKITLVDTVKSNYSEEMISRIKSIIDPAKIDYIIVNHIEMDHTGALPAIMKYCKNAKLFASAQGEKGLKLHFKQDWDIKVVESHEKLKIGSRTLEFILTPMVHWPDSMITYIAEDKLLLPNDMFGQHYASNERYDDEVGFDILNDEAAKYFANIMMPYASMVKKAAKEVLALDIDMIAPSHGVIWRKDYKKIIDQYLKWSNNSSNNRAAIFYDTMWDSTRKMAYAIYNAFEEKKIYAQLVNLKFTHISDAMAQVLCSKYICVGSSTINNGMLPTVAAFLTFLKECNPKNKVAMAFGSYGWSGQSIKDVDAALINCNFKMMESLKFQFVPQAENLEEITQKMKKNLELSQSEFKA